MISGPVCLGAAVPPAPADVKAKLGRQLDHVVVVAAVSEGLPKLGLGFSQGHEGIELLDLLEELLELGFGHQLSIGFSVLLRLNRSKCTPRIRSSSLQRIRQPSFSSRGVEIRLASVTRAPSLS